LHSDSDADDFIKPDEYDTFRAAETGGKIKLLEPGIGLECAFFMSMKIQTRIQKPASLMLTRKKLKWFRNTKFPAGLRVCD